MNKLLSLIIPFFLFFLQNSFAQTPIVYDVKGDEERFEKFPDGIIKREIASFNISGSGWGKHDSTIKSPVTEILVLKATETSVTFSKKPVSISIKATPFDTAGHTFTYSDPKSPFLTHIDGKPFWGTDGGMPKEKITSIVYKNGSTQFSIPEKGLANLFEPNFCYMDTEERKVKCHCAAYESPDKKRIYIYMLNSDGAGGYEVTWIIENNTYLGRIVDFGF